MKEYEHKNVDLAQIKVTPTVHIATDHNATERPHSEIRYNQHPLQSLNDKIEACLQKQRELNFLAREVSAVLKKLK